MTRKDYERLAAALKDNRYYDPEAAQYYDTAIQAVAKACKAENPLFNTERFLKASGIE